MVKILSPRSTGHIAKLFGKRRRRTRRISTRWIHTYLCVISSVPLLESRVSASISFSRLCEILQMGPYVLF